MATSAGASTVQFAVSVVEGNGVIHTVVSAPVAAGTFHHVLVSLDPQQHYLPRGDRFGAALH